MCEIIEMHRREAAIAAVAKSIKNLMETMNLTAEQAMKALKIPASDYNKYMALV